MKKKHIQSIYMQSNPRILVNLLVILVKIPVNLLVKPTKLGNMIDMCQDYLDKTPRYYPKKVRKKSKVVKG